MVGTGRFPPQRPGPVAGDPGTAEWLGFASHPSQAGLGNSPERTPRLGCFVGRPQERHRIEFLSKTEMVGTGRFELPTPRTPSECSTRLSHVPTQSSRLG
jgi:hypothetical protein